PVIEEHGVPGTALFLKPHLFRQGETGLVFRKGPPGDAVKVELFERLPQQQSDDLRSVSFLPPVLFPDGHTDVRARRPTGPSVNVERRPSDRLPATLFLDDVVPLPEVVPFDCLLVAGLQGFAGNRVVRKRSGKAHDVLIVLPSMEMLQVLSFKAPQENCLAGQQGSSTGQRSRILKDRPYRSTDCTGRATPRRSSRSSPGPPSLGTPRLRRPGRCPRTFGAGTRAGCPPRCTGSAGRPSYIASPPAESTSFPGTRTHFLRRRTAPLERCRRSG